jgi:2-desacetyl-2-hydroxyethyl bacteriochlorophyllide A dehydrogenase
MNARQVVFPAPRQVELCDRSLPDPGPGQALLRTLCTLISTGTELTALTGEFPPDSAWARYVQYPWTAGYSHVGVVEQVGEGVEEVRPGDRLVSHAPHADRAVVTVSRAERVPPEISPEAASFLPLAQITLNGVRQGEVALGESVVVLGAGLIGQLTARFCLLAGARPLLLVDQSQPRLLHAADTRCVRVPATDEGEVVRAVESKLGGLKADVVIEASGNPALIPLALRLARRRGRVVILGSPRGPVAIDFHDEVHTLGLRIIGAHNSTHPPTETPDSPWTLHRHARLFFDLLADGSLDVTPLITHRFPGARSADAYQMLLEDRTRAMGVILEWEAAAS